jgi:hypothetical protein
VEGVYACLLLYRIGVVCLKAYINSNAAAAGGAAAGCGCISIGVRVAVGVGVGAAAGAGGAGGGAACLSSGCLHREGHDCANH